MAEEISDQMQGRFLTKAANLGTDEQLTNICGWLMNVKLLDMTTLACQPLRFTFDTLNVSIEMVRKTKSSSVFV